MGEETTVLVAPLGIVRKVEAIAFEILPEKLGRERMVLGPVPGASIDAFKGPSDRIVRLPVP